MRSFSTRSLTAWSVSPGSDCDEAAITPATLARSATPA